MYKRQVYLISTGPVYITDPNEAGTVAGGGVFFRTEFLDPRTRKGKVEMCIRDRYTLVKLGMHLAGTSQPEESISYFDEILDPSEPDPVRKKALSLIHI